jgi:hypothetical protein
MLEAGSGIEPLYTDFQSERGLFSEVPETAIVLFFQLAEISSHTVHAIDLDHS